MSKNIPVVFTKTQLTELCDGVAITLTELEEHKISMPSDNKDGWLDKQIALYTSMLETIETALNNSKETA